MTWNRLFIAELIHLFYRAYSWTYRVRRACDHWTTTKFPDRSPVIFAHWHEDDMSLVSPHRNLGYYILISLSKDGDLLAHTMKRMGYHVVRGSSSRGGAKGLIQLIRAVRTGSDAIITVDGPRGPRREVKPGIITLAQKTGASIVPLASFAKRKIVFKRSWSQTYLPYAFSRVEIVFSEQSIPPPRDDSDESIERCRIAVQQELCRLHEIASSS